MPLLETKPIRLSEVTKQTIVLPQDATHNTCLLLATYLPLREQRRRVYVNVTLSLCFESKFEPGIIQLQQTVLRVTRQLVECSLPVVTFKNASTLHGRVDRYTLNYIPCSQTCTVITCSIKLLLAEANRPTCTQDGSSTTSCSNLSNCLLKTSDYLTCYHSIFTVFKYWCNIYF